MDSHTIVGDIASQYSPQTQVNHQTHKQKTENQRVGQSTEENRSVNNPQDVVSISPEAKEKAENAQDTAQSANSNKSSLTGELTKEELALLQDLKQRDQEVRRHEQAHLAAAGRYAQGGASFTLQKGPDGASYAVGGEVNIDMSKEQTPEDTIGKMQTIQRAALAPASPSTTDRQVAASASVKESQARQELMQQQQEQLLAAKESSQQTGIASPQENSIGNSSEPPSTSTFKNTIPS